MKTQNEGNVKNVYCLSLPTYNLEENDTVHGSLLLIGGKLVALYLQVRDSSLIKDTVSRSENNERKIKSSVIKVDRYS